MTRSRAYTAAVIPLLLYFLLATHAARATSLTVDEGLHIASGYTILRTGDYRLVEEHPPAIKLWLAAPLLPLYDLADPATLPAWDEAAHPTTESLPLLHMAQQLLYPSRPVERWLVPARAMEALLGVLLLATITRWAADLWGTRGALGAALFAALDPNLLAHGAVAGTDLGATTLIVLALYAAQRFLARPSLRRAALTGIVLGAALTAKLTAALLGPVLAVAGLVRLFQSHGHARKRLFRLGLLVIGLTSLAFWAVYGFQTGSVPGVPFPVPAAAHATPVLRLAEHSAGGHQAFLFGENSMRGWWWYFPAAFALKTPLPALILVVWLCLRFTFHVSRFRAGAFGRRFHNVPLWLFPLLYIVASLLSPLNIGYRHLLPVLPFLYIGIGAMGRRKYEVRNKRLAHHVSRFTFYALGTWLAAGTLALTPHYLTFFNEIAGGPRNGWRFLADSNTDWGQGYAALARFQETQHIDSVQLSAFIFYDPAIYGVNYTPLTPLRGDTPAIFPARFAPPPGDYAISTTPLDGIPLADPEMYDWFRWRAPDAQIANALHYYHVTAAETTIDWIAQCTHPTPPLDAAASAEGFGSDDIRRVDFDCTQSWIIPAGGQTPGRYVIHGALLEDTYKSRLHMEPPSLHDPVIAHHLGQTRISYRQRAYHNEPAFAIYTAVPEKVTMPTITAWAAPAATSPDALATRLPREGSIALDGPLAFIGAESTRDAETLTVETWWRVTGTPTGRPLSVMGHLLDATGEVTGIADGLGVPAAAWQPGDIIIQRHAFPLPADGNRRRNIFLRTGVYWLDDGSRWHITTSQADALFIALPAFD